jgi:GTP cyclohydrolase I
MRVAKMYLEELFWGLNPNNFPKCTVVENKMGYDEMVIEKGVSVMSTCEHHFQTIVGTAAVAYIPNQKVLGLSKIPRIVEYFSRRPQIQERLTEQIYFALSYILDTEDVAVVIDAEHFCVKARGVQDHGSTTITSKLGGGFRNDPALRSEFMNLIRK